MAYHILKACFPSDNNRRPTRPQGGPGGGGGGGAGGWFGGSGSGGTRPNPGAPPPPYSKDDPSSTAGTAGWRPGFWTGLGLGGLAGRWFQPSPLDQYRAQQERMMRPSLWDWERPGGWLGTRRQEPTRARPAAAPQTSQRATGWFRSSDDRGEGSSNGATRRSTGYGGSLVR